MPAVFKIADGVPCRACGAVLAPAGGNDYGLCKNCWTAACLHSGASIDLHRTHQKQPPELLENAVNEWLAHKLVKDMKRLARDGIVGRCEAISGWSYGTPGTQCAKSATMERDGHKVCGKHFKATAPVYVSDRTADYYEMLRDNIEHLASIDERFRRVLREVVS